MNIYTQGGSCWDCILIDPERDPGQDNNQGTGDICLNGEITHPSAQVKVDGQHHIFT